MPNQLLGFLLNARIDLDGMFELMLQSPEVKLEARNELANYGLMVEDFGKALTVNFIVLSLTEISFDKGAVSLFVKVKNADGADK